VDAMPITALEVLPRSPDDPFAILFTSGSTGTPKGAVRSYAAFFDVISTYEIGHAARHLSFQPVSHLSERMYLPALLLYGSTIAFSRGGAHLLDELAAFEPTQVGSVPRLYEVLHAQYLRRLRALVREAPTVPRRTHEARALAEARATFGTRVQSVSVGSAPVSAEVYAFMKRCFADLWVSEGYGSTEVGSIAFDGQLAKDVELKLVAPPDDADRPPALPGDPERGEIWVKTPHPITGYLADDGTTVSPLDADGFFATGDLGERDERGRVRVIGRVRNTVKLAQGEFVSAERIEAVLGSAPSVDRIYAHVVAGATGVAVVVFPSADADRDEGRLLATLRTHGRAGGLAAYELPRGVIVDAEIADGLFTASNKIARAPFVARYGARLAPMIAARSGPDDDEAVRDDGDDDLLAIIQRVVARVVGRAPDPHEALGAGIGVDSLAVAEILAALADELGRDVPLSWWFEARDLADLAGRLGRFAGGTEGATRELAAADRVLPGRFGTTFTERPIARVLLTGATGFLGAHLVEALHARGLAVTCLVRGTPDRLVAALARYRIPVAVDGDRVRVVSGDLAAIPFGELADVDAIVHAAATVSWLASYHALRGPNVLGTHALLEFAAARGLAMHHVSTISTCPVGGDEVALLGFEAALAGTPYGLSKWIAEGLALRARAAGLPVAIHRPAMIAGHSTRGTGNPDDFVQRYLAGCVELGCYLDRDDAVQDLTPVDFVAAAIAALVASHGRATYQLVNVDQSPTFAALGRALVAAGHAVAPASYETFRARLHDRKDSRLHALGAFFPERFALGSGPWPCAATLAALVPLGVVRPAIDAAVLAVYASSLVSANV
ncbi:MAG: AMP-binding protein, partial [Proteobacteria bacterium]|nr:AMP-binding protein [Pseudomonadota bacterium]